MVRMIVAGAALLALMGSVRPAAAELADARPAMDYLSRASWKLARGVTNVVAGIPSEVLMHVVEEATGPEASSGGAFVTGIMRNTVVGSGWGLLRAGSGLVDVLTFPVGFNDNRPLMEPEFRF